MVKGPEEMIGDLLDRSHLMDPSRLTDEVARAVALAGATDVCIYLVDYEQRALITLEPAGSAALDIDATLGGRSFVTGELARLAAGDRHQYWLPLIDGVDRLGVMTLVVEEDTDSMRTWCLRLSGLVSLLIATKRPYTTAFARTARRRTPTVAAEVQWSQVPPLTFATSRVAIAGILEPAYDIGGDSFDYAHTSHRTDVVVIDAMGHGLHATWPATLAIASLRRARSEGLELAEQYATTSALLAEELQTHQFVAAQMAQLDDDTGVIRWLNAGLPAPLLVRGEKVIGEVSCRPSPPLGIGTEVSELAELQLEPWDRMVFFTDGVIEGHQPGTEPFGLDRLVDLVGREALAGNGVAETVRRLAHAVLDHHHHELRDDFTMVAVEYRGAGDIAEAVPFSYRLPDQRSV